MTLLKDMTPEGRVAAAAAVVIIVVFLGIPVLAYFHGRDHTELRAAKEQACLEKGGLPIAGACFRADSVLDEGLYQ